MSDEAKFSVGDQVRMKCPNCGTTCPCTDKYTGRTTKMLKDAIEVVKSGKDVVIVGISEGDCKRLKKMAETLFSEIYYSPRIKYISMNDMKWNWSSGVYGFHGDVFVDHYAIEYSVAQITQWKRSYDGILDEHVV